MGGFEIDAEAVRALARLLDETGLGEIEYEHDDRRIRVAKPGVAAVAAAPPAPPPAAVSNGAATPDARLAGAAASPMVGTVYLQAGPGEPPFVKVGDTIAAGETIAIIEAMKVMNQIPAPHGGVVRSIGVENGQAVEFGEVLMVIE